MLAPYAPHITEELWYMVGEKESIHLTAWPEYDPSKVKEETVTIGIQVNGKLRDMITIAKDANEKYIEEQALSQEKIRTLLADQKPKKVIVVPGRIVNIVV
jgi:leucyl-tRNA synthetase